ncbi:hypothetical protein [Streptomyces cupreus]|uniref:hypothetical protein n=1 Tax=Streptomyces cupreus TaxID=2759956 RepID=UPI0021B38C3D|nr:hypothetical protein [Streptomyces cupreus]
MSRPHADFASARLRLWQRRVKETAGLMVLPEVGTAQADLVPVLDQLVAVHNLTSGLVSDLRQTAESSLAGTDVGVSTCPVWPPRLRTAASPPRTLARP